MDFDFTPPKASFIQTGLNGIQKLENDQQTKPIIKFLELFWFYHPDPIKGIDEKHKLDLLIMSLNLNSGNVRLNGYLNVKEQLHNQALFITSETVHASIFSTGLFYIRHLKNGETYRPIEQLHMNYDPQTYPWQNELATTTFQKSNDMIKLTINMKEDVYYYLFKGQQVELLKHAIDFVLSDGLCLVGKNK